MLVAHRAPPGMMLYLDDAPVKASGRLAARRDDNRDNDAATIR